MRKILALLLLCLAPPAAAQNYQATAGSGTTFGTKLVSAVNYPQFVVCDPTTPAQCAAVDASGRLSIIPNTAMNIAQINGVTPLMGNGATGTGSQRITIANDNTIPTGWPTAANQTIVNTWASGTLGAMANYGTSPGAVLVPGVNAFVTNTLTALTPGDGITTGTYASGSPTLGAVLLWNGTTYDRWKSTATGFAGVNPGTPANWGIGATAAAVPANALYNAFNSGGNLVGVAAATPLPARPGDGTRNAIIDPCEANLQTYATGVITSATTTRIIAPSASNKTYLCMFFTKASAADNVGVVEGTGGTCGTGTAALIGGTTAANGFVFGTAGDGVLLQAGGKVAAVQTAGTNVDLCLITSTTGPLIWSAKYVQAP